MCGLTIVCRRLHVAGEWFRRHRAMNKLKTTCRRGGGRNDHDRTYKRCKPPQACPEAAIMPLPRPRHATARSPTRMRAAQPLSCKPQRLLATDQGKPYKMNFRGRPSHARLRGPRGLMRNKSVPTWRWRRQQCMHQHKLHPNESRHTIRYLPTSATSNSRNATKSPLPTSV